MKYSYRMLMIIVLYMFFLRLILHFTIPISIFSVGMVLDLLSVFPIVAVLSLLLPNRRLQQLVISLILGFWSFLVVADGVYNRYFLTLLSKINAQGLSLMNPSHVIEYDLKIPWPYIFILITLIIVIYMIYRVKQKEKYTRYGIILAMLFIMVQGVIFSTLVLPKSSESIEYYQSDSYLLKSMHNRILFAERYGYYNYHWIDLLQFPRAINKEETTEKVDAFFEAKSVHDDNIMSGIFKDYNLIFITVESLDTRFIDESITPRLYQMLHHGYRFDRFYVPVFQQGATCNSEFMAITGLIAFNSNRYSNNICDSYKDNYFPYALPNQLKEAGYQTYYFHSGYEWFYQRESIIPNYGFESVKFIEDLNLLGIDDFDERLDTELMKFIESFVTLDENHPFYIHFLTYGLHGAYNQTHDNDIDLINSVPKYENIDSTIKVYLQKLIELDRFLDMLITWLVAENVYDDTLFVIHADHHPFMLEEDIYAEFLNIDYHTEELFQQDLILYNSQMSPQVFQQVGSTVDITPTLLNLLYPEGEFKYFIGNDLFSEETGYVLLHDLSIIDGVNRYYLRKPYSGDLSQKELLKNKLSQRISTYNMQMMILNIDYFKILSEK